MIERDVQDHAQEIKTDTQRDQDQDHVIETEVIETEKDRDQEKDRANEEEIDHAVVQDTEKMVEINEEIDRDQEIDHEIEMVIKQGKIEVIQERKIVKEAHLQPIKVLFHLEEIDQDHEAKKEKEIDQNQEIVQVQLIENVKRPKGEIKIEKGIVMEVKKEKDREKEIEVVQDQKHQNQNKERMVKNQKNQVMIKKEIRKRVKNQLRKQKKQNQEMIQIQINQ